MKLKIHYSFPVTVMYETHENVWVAHIPDLHIIAEDKIKSNAIDIVRGELEAYLIAMYNQGDGDCEFVKPSNIWDIQKYYPNCKFTTIDGDIESKDTTYTISLSDTTNSK